MDSVLAEAGEALRDAGFPAWPPRFPFAMHHGFYRSRIRAKGRKTTHAQVSQLLAEWAVGRESPADYARQAVCGAVKAMLSRNPELAGRIPPAVRTAMAAVGGGYDFRQFGAARASAGAAAERVTSDEGVLSDERVLDELAAGQAGDHPGVQT